MLKKLDFLIIGGVLLLFGCVYAASSDNKEKKEENGGSSWFKSEPPKPKTMEEIIADTVSVAYLMGKFEPSEHADFVQIAKEFTDKSSAYLRKETYKAFLEMEKAAQKEGIKLKILSATRNFNRQKKIWEDKWTGIQKVEDGTNVAKSIKDPVARARKILLFSSMPGSSRHHWGTDVDFNYLSDDYFTHGQGKKIYSWLQKNAATYGFCQPYSDKSGGRTGYQEEKWHWTYMPLSKGFTEGARLRMKDEMISGFQGSETAVEINIVKNYVLGINKNCL
jgi:zinc D-Ala-D-Ala carboxypeptidase